MHQCGNPIFAIRELSRIWSSRIGISLVEIMIALVIFGIGVSMALRMTPESSVVTTRSRNITTAVNLALEKMEELMSLPYSDAELTQGSHSDPRNPLDLHFVRTWQVQVNQPVQGMKQVSVTVRYPTASTDSTVTLDTFLTSRR